MLRILTFLGIGEDALPHIKLNLLFAAMITPLIAIFEKYIFSDWQFVAFMAVLIAVDTITGVWYAFEKGDFSSNRLGGLIRKIILYVLALVSVHAATSFTVDGHENMLMEIVGIALDSVIYSCFMIRELLSITENLGKLGFVFLPPWVMKRFRDFNEHGIYAPAPAPALAAQPAAPQTGMATDIPQDTAPPFPGH